MQHWSVNETVCREHWCAPTAAVKVVAWSEPTQYDQLCQTVQCDCRAHTPGQTTALSCWTVKD